MPYGNNIFGIGLDYTNELNSRTVKVYDVEKKELIDTYPSVRAASKATGVPVTSISRYIKDKSRSSKNSLNKIICFR